MLCSYLVEFQATKSMPSTSNFYTQALTFVNRVILLNTDFFLNFCISRMKQQYNMTFEQFVDSWISKMDLLLSQEARRINLLALYNIVPSFSAELV